MDTKKIANLESLLRDKVAQAERMIDASDVTTEQIKAVYAEAEDLQSRIEQAKKFVNFGMMPYGEEPVAEFKDTRREDEIKALNCAAGHQDIKFSGETRAERAMKAYRFAQWVQAGLMNNRKSQKWCMERGIEIKGHNEFENEVGGYLVPEEFVADLIVLREQYGVFRRNTRIVPMVGDVTSRPRRRGGVTAYYVGETATINESEMNWDRVRLVTKKLAALVKLSSELNEDSAIELANTVADEVAYAFANQEDLAGFIGDGTSTYGGVVGVTPKLRALDATVANIAGLVQGTGTGFSGLTLANFRTVVGRVPQFADGANTKWYVHRGFYHEVMLKLAEATSGTSATDIVNGQVRQYFMGYPVEFAQVLPKNSASNIIPVVLGDLRLGTMMGNRKDVSLALSEHAAFSTDELTLRGTQRFDINVHDVGNASATASLQQAGPIVGLITG